MVCVCVCVVGMAGGNVQPCIIGSMWESTLGWAVSEWKKREGARGPRCRPAS